jgi:hypothetical protein
MLNMPPKLMLSIAHAPVRPHPLVQGSSSRARLWHRYPGTQTRVQILTPPTTPPPIFPPSWTSLRVTTSSVSPDGTRQRWTRQYASSELLDPSASTVLSKIDFFYFYYLLFIYFFGLLVCGDKMVAIIVSILPEQLWISVMWCRPPPILHRLYSDRHPRLWLPVKGGILGRLFSRISAGGAAKRANTEEGRKKKRNPKSN